MSLTVKARAALAGGGCAIGSWITAIDSPVYISLLGRIGYDFAYVDMEHSTFSIETVSRHIAAGRAANISVIVRPPALDYPVGRLMDCGAHGVILAGVRSAGDIRTVVDQVKYRPLGQRGSATIGPHTDYMLADAEYLEQANRGTLVIAQLESEEAFKNLDSIMDVEGLDVIVVGRNDLSHDLGVPGQIEHPLVIERVVELVDRTASSKVVPGLLLPDGRAAEKWIARGMRWLPISTDLRLIRTTLQDTLAEVQRHLPRSSDG